MTNLLTGTANKSEVPVVDVTEQMPKQYDSLTDWVAALVDSITTAYRIRVWVYVGWR